MAIHGFYLRVRSTGLSPAPILLTDVNVGSGGALGAGRGGNPKPGPCYVPVTGYIDLLYTSVVALSFEEGNIRKFVDAGYLTVELKASQEAHAAVQAWSGWAHYDDTPNTQNVLAGVTTTLTNDATGPRTVTTYLPEEVTQFWDTGTNQMDFTDLRVGSVLAVRLGLEITPAINNSYLHLRIWFLSFGGWALEHRLARLDEGAGLAYPISQEFSFYIGSEEVRTSGARIELHCGSDAVVSAKTIFVRSV